MPSPPESRRVPSTPHFVGAVNDQWRMFSDNPEDYSIGLPIGFGATSIVYLSRYVPADGLPSIPCATKVVDLDKLSQSSLRLLRRETQLMSLSKHPNVLRVRGSWMTGHNLCIALRLMNAGSAADVMHYGWPGGMDEEVVKCILKQALEGLNYLHVNGFIHRDVKAANLLIDDDGTVLLGDLGVSASLSDDEAAPQRGLQSMNFDGHGWDNNKRPGSSVLKTERLGKRKSFVGTPCWMAPEIISGKQYDAKADIWSFGITAIELTQGRAPRSRETPARVLLKTVQDEPPNFSRENGQHKFTKAFKEIVESCLAKDPYLRPSAAELLETPFFKCAKKKSHLVGTILKDLPPLTSRQERRLNSHVPHSIARSSMSEWDFTMDLHHSIVTTHDLSRPWLNSLEAASSATTNSIIRHRQQNSPSPGHLHLSRPGTENGGKADWPQTDSHRMHGELQSIADEKSHQPSSSDSSVFELSDNEPSEAIRKPGYRQDSSAVTTPLSCSPAVVPAVSPGRAVGKHDEAKLVVRPPPCSSSDKGNDIRGPGRRARRLSMPVDSRMKLDSTEPREISQRPAAPTTESHRGSMHPSFRRCLSLSQLTKPTLLGPGKPSSSLSGTGMPAASSENGSSSAKDTKYACSATTQAPSQAQDATAINKGPSRWRMLIRGFSPGGRDRSREPEQQRRNRISRFLDRSGNENTSSS